MQAHHLTHKSLPKPPSLTHPDYLRPSLCLRTTAPTTPGKHILITNASHAPGPSIALSFARAGATAITLSNPTASSLTPLAAALKLINPICKILTIACDTTRSSSVVRLFSAAKAAFGTLDIVVANVGAAHLSSKDGQEGGDGNDEWWDDMTTNFRSTHLPAHQG
ncbi:Nad-p-binding protein [Pyrenophora tritici-repentis]|uniref:Nad-p-binding protein n=1 Tax=Pyrenophora tritici-repentis TaxID=45151 RepID=A0A922NH98_9PLEO|nr:Nad-p-binding protein [Pyrenophora tritici-repentis]KAI1678613.1 Nad-p-binding protein [Pyrenophora tritici-repentis]